MRVLHTTLGYPPSRGLGGPTRIVANLATELVRQGHDIEVYCTNLHTKSEKLSTATLVDIRDNVRVSYFDTRAFTLWPGTVGPMLIKELRPALRKSLRSFDLVHVHGYREAFSATVINECLRIGMPYLVQPHGVLPRLGPLAFAKLITDLRLRRQLKCASALIALSDVEEAQCRALGGPRVPVFRMVNGVRLEEYDPLPRRGKFRRAVGVADEETLVLSLGRLNWIKGIDILIRAFARRKEDYKLVIVGEGDKRYEHELKALRDALGLHDRIIFAGPWPPERVMEAYVDADLFVLTSRKELFAMTLLEACLARVPQVIVDSCEIASLLEGKVAWVTPLSEEAIASAIDAALRNVRKRTEYAENGPRLVRELFSIETAATRLETYYHTVLNTVRATC